MSATLWPEYQRIMAQASKEEVLEHDPGPDIYLAGFSRRAKKVRKRVHIKRKIKEKKEGKVEEIAVGMKEVKIAIREATSFPALPVEMMTFGTSDTMSQSEAYKTTQLLRRLRTQLR